VNFEVDDLTGWILSSPGEEYVFVRAWHVLLVCSPEEVGVWSILIRSRRLTSDWQALLNLTVSFFISKFSTAYYSAVNLLRAGVVWALIWFQLSYLWSQTSETVENPACICEKDVWSILIRSRWSTSNWQALLKTYNNCDSRFLLYSVV
jgi:hypothetical protein